MTTITREQLRNKTRLLNVAKALREAREPKAFTMKLFAHDDQSSDWLNSPAKKFDCGTPACALGHYAARRDLQRAFEIETETIDIGFGSVRRNASLVESKDGYPVYIDNGRGHDAIVKHFGITDEQVEELFSVDGCGNAKTAKQAAAYIEKFVKRNF